MPFDAETYEGSAQSQPVTVTAKAATETPRLLDRDPKSLTDPRERLEYLRDFLRELPAERFDLSKWFGRDGERVWGWDPDAWSQFTAGSAIAECGTVACMAGHAMALFTPDAAIPHHPGNAAAIVLGLHFADAADLFEPLDLPGDLCRSDISTAQAANVLDHLLNTGKVDWSVA